MTDPIREPDFGCPFDAEQKALAQELVESGRARLLEQTRDDLFEARVRIFNREVEVWLLRAPGGVEHECSCPHLENTGQGCAHRFALMLLANRRLGEADADEAAPIRPTYVLVPGGRGLDLALRWRGEDAEGAWRPLPADGDHLVRVEDPADRAALAVLEAAAGGRRSLLEGGGFRDPQGPWTLPAAKRVEALVTLAKTGRLRLADRKGRPGPRLDVETGAPRELVLRLRRDRRGDESLEAVLTGEGEPIPVADCDAVATDAPAFAVHRGRLVAVEACGAEEWLGFFREKRALAIPGGGSAAFLGRLAASGALPRVQLAGDAAPLPVEEGTPRGALTVAREGAELIAVLSFLYAGRPVPYLGSNRLVLDLGQHRQLRRSADREATLEARLRTDALEPDGERPGTWRVDGARFDALAAALVREGWELRVDGRPFRAPGTVACRIESGVDWFDLEARVPYGDASAPLAEVVRAWREGRSFVVLGDGSSGLVPAEWLERMRGILELAREREDGLRFHRAQAPLLAALADSVSMEPPPGLVRTAEALARMGSPAPLAPPAGFEGTLRPYQAAGLGWLRALTEAGLSGCLADDMGLGKTVQTLAWIAGLKERGALAEGVLLVAPRSLVFNWRREAARFVPDLAVTVHLGSARATAAKDLRGDLVVTTYGTLVRDVDWLRQRPFAAVVLDEAQAIKNPDSRRARAARALVAPHRLALTGTPIENHLGELWSLMEFLEPGLCGPRKRFAERLGARDAGAARATLWRALRPLVLRRTKEEVAPDLPERIEQVLYVEMSEADAAFYADQRERAREALRPLLDGAADAPSKLHVLEALLRLRQAACHPGLVDPDRRDGVSSKVGLLVDELEQVRDAGHRALVFSQFTSLLDLVAPRLEAAGLDHVRLDGTTRDRDAVVERFQDPEGPPVFLISLMAGGTGLNLTAADYVFLLDPWWNPAIEAQAIDRAHRIGRERRVVAHRLVTRGTVEEHIIALQERKAALVAGFFEEDPVRLADLTAADLDLLLGA